MTIYKKIFRPLLFSFAPEGIHSIVSKTLEVSFHIPGFPKLLHRYTTVQDKSLEKTVFGLTFENPVGIAAGFDKNATLYNYLGKMGFGFVEVGTITPKPQPGNPKPRLFRITKDKALINRMGFNNDGVKAAKKHLQNKKTEALIGGNLGKNTLTPNNQAVNDYALLFEELFDVVDYFVVNVSCPNISDLRELQDQSALFEILNRLQFINSQKEKRKPILLKVSPDLNNNQLDEVIDIVKQTHIDGVVAVNTTITRNNLTTSTEKINKIGKGGLSGKPIYNRAVEVVRYLSENSHHSFPIIGVGGIFTPEDAINMLKAGADLIQVYTGFIYEGPLIARRINKALIKYFKDNQQ